MRIDFVITELFVGGAERCLTEVATGLADSDDQVRVFSLASLPTGQQRLLVDRLRQANVAVETGGADRPWQYLSARRKLITWLSDSKPDVCQTFLHHANALGTFAARSAGVDVCVGGLRVAESRPIRCLLERQAVKQMDSLVCVSRAVREFAGRKLGCPENKSIVIPNGVDVSRFSSATPYAWSQIGWPDDSVVSLFVGRFHSQKGIEHIQSQIDKLAPRDSNRRVLLIGEGPLRNSVSAWASSVGDQRVQVLPWQPDIAPQLKASRLLLLPSRYEGMPNVVLEAMASGLPVVCSRVEGSQEIVAHDRERQSFESGDAEAMASLANTFLSDPDLSAEVGISNQQRVRAHFSIPAMLDAYRSHYRTLIHRD